MRRRGTVWVLFLLLWVALGVFSAGAVLVELPAVRRMGPPPPGTLSMAARTFLWQLAIWLAWVVVAPAALWLRHRWPLERGALKRALPVHLVAVILFCGVHSGFVLLTRALIMQSQPIDGQQATAILTYWVVRDLPFAALFYGLILEAYDNYVRLHVGGKAHLLRQTMNELEAALNPEQFARIHRSTIVNLDRVKELHPHFNEHLIVLQDGTELKLSRTRKDWLEQWLGTGAGLE